MRSLRIFSIGTFILLCVAISIIWFNPVLSSHAQSATPVIPRQAKAMGPYMVKGNAILGVDVKPYYFN